MNYTEAVRLAKAGDEKGYYFLYKEVYESKYYLALKYMQNEEEAKDVLQDAYIKAFSKLDTLENPEKFPSWFGIIVANTAKNALKKNNPMLFTDIAVNANEEEFEYQIEDENVQTQPEMAYSQKETQKLVREIIDSLSEEQRMCILMFHIEGYSISEIADALGCSENTVKSRLNYGRKNIKAKAEELQKKGYKLYSLAPVPLLLYLLRLEKKVFAAEAGFKAVEESMIGNIVNSVKKASAAQSAGVKASSKVIKQGFMHTFAGKAAATGVSICIVAAGVTGVVMNHNKAHQDSVNTVAVEEKQEKKDAEVKKEEIEDKEVKERHILDGEYPSLLSGGITKEEFEFLLAYGPELIADSTPSVEDMCDMVFRLGMTGEYYNISFQRLDTDTDAWMDYSLEEINNFISVFQYSFKEEDNNQYSNVLKVYGNVISIIIVEPNTTRTAMIEDAKLKGDEIKIEYQLQESKFDDDTGEERINVLYKTVQLRKCENGSYRIISITDRDI